MKILYPSIFKEIDPCFQEEYEYCKTKSIETCFLDEETKKINTTNSDLIYRGWILKENEYKSLEEECIKKGNTLFTNLEEYLFSNYISNWYPLLKDYTMETVIVEDLNNLEKIMEELNWEEGYFLKDFVKSLKTDSSNGDNGEGSIAMNYQEAQLIIDEMIKTRGEIEGSLVLRKVVKLKPNSERRFFSLNGTILGPPESEIDDFFYNIQDLLPKKHFVSIDIAKLQNGEKILIEIGDGQVSDMKSENDEILPFFIKTALKIPK